MNIEINIIIIVFEHKMYVSAIKNQLNVYIDLVIISQYCMLYDILNCAVLFIQVVKIKGSGRNCSRLHLCMYYIYYFFYIFFFVQMT